MRNRSMTRAKAEPGKEKTGWSWNTWKRERRKKKMQQKLLKTMQESSWAGLAGGLIAGAAGLLAFFALQSASEKKKAGKLAGNLASGRTLFQLSSRSATQPRFERNRSFGWF